MNMQAGRRALAHLFALLLCAPASFGCRNVTPLERDLRAKDLHVRDSLAALDGLDNPAVAKDTAPKRAEQPAVAGDEALRSAPVTPVGNWQPVSESNAIGIGLGRPEPIVPPSLPDVPDEPD
jgi:hypothetical protein